MKVSIKKEFSDDYISRTAGERLREMILAAAKKSEVIEIDFSEITIASTSFFDEAFGKLAQEGWDQQKFNSSVKLKNIKSRDEDLLRSLGEYRGLFRS